MNFRNIAVFIAVLSGLAFSQNVPISYELRPDSSSVKMILKYDLGYAVQNEIESLQKMINNKAYAEFHLGGGVLVDKQANTDKVATLGIKVSPLKPKLPFVENIRAKSFKIRELAAIMGDSLSARNQGQLNAIDKELALYDRDAWKRFSLMLQFPFHLNKFDTAFYLSPVDSQYQSRIYKRSEADFLQQIIFAIGYDLGKIGTVSVGSTMAEHPSFSAGLSIDVSTPTYTAVVSFIEHLKSYSNARLPGSYYYGGN